MSNMSVNVAGVEWKNPVTVASGAFCLLYTSPRPRD